MVLQTTTRPDTDGSYTGIPNGIAIESMDTVGQQTHNWDVAWLPP
jgi:hypothetical protein